MTEVVWTSLAPLGAERATVRRTLLLAMPAGLLLATIGGWLVGWRVLAPLSSMARQVNAIDDRALESRIAVRNSGDELSALAAAFNGLLDRLTLTFQAQRRFMADASHQLRTPLSIARIAAQVTLAQDDRATEEYRSSLQTVAQQTERMTRMVDDMFALALADLDARPLQLEEVYLNEVVTECVQRLGAGRLAAWRVAGHERGRDADAGRRSLVSRMIVNLRGERSASTRRPGGSVRGRRCEAVLGGARDRGLGHGAGDPGRGRERVFERFVRLDATRSVGGGGLGLSIARWVAELHRGTLTSKPRGRRAAASSPSSRCVEVPCRRRSRWSGFDGFDRCWFEGSRVRRVLRCCWSGRRHVRSNERKPSNYRGARTIEPAEPVEPAGNAAGARFTVVTARDRMALCIDALSRSRLACSSPPRGRSWQAAPSAGRRPPAPSSRR